MVIDIIEEEPHEKIVTVRVKKILRTLPPQQVTAIKPEIRGKEQFVNLVLESSEYLDGVYFYLNISGSWQAIAL